MPIPKEFQKFAHVRFATRLHHLRLLQSDRRAIALAKSPFANLSADFLADGYELSLAAPDFAKKLSWLIATDWNQLFTLATVPSRSSASFSVGTV